MKIFIKLSVVIGCLVMSSLLLNAQEKEPIATVTLSLGDVFVKQVLKSDWLDVQVGALIYEGDKIRTKETGKAEVTFLDGSIVFLGKDTEIEFIDQNSPKVKKDSIFLFFGSIWNQVKEGVEYEVETVHALATVRGTYFNVQVDDEMAVWVKEGLVFIENEFGKVEAAKNSLTKVTKDSSPKKEAVKTSQLPDDIDFSADFYIDVNVASTVNKDEWYKVTGFVKKKGANTTVSEDIVFNVRGSSQLMVSLDKQAQEATIPIETKNGLFEFYIKSLGDQESFTLTHSKMQSQTIYLSFNEVQKKKNVIIEFKDQENKVRRINAVFEKR